MNKDDKTVEIVIRRRKLKINKDCRATIGVAAGEGRLIKPLVKAGKQHHRMKAQGRKWHRTSAVKVNAIDHPFGGGRGKRIKSKIAKRNAPPGRKVGHIRPKQQDIKTKNMETDNKPLLKKKEFKYRGKSLEELNELDIREFSKLLKSNEEELH